MREELPRELAVSVTDRAGSLLKSTTSAIDLLVPGLGSVFGELVSHVLPRNREDRIAYFVAKLDQRLRLIEYKIENEIFDLDEEQIALVEDALRSSARATQKQRLDEIAELVATGLVVPARAEQQRAFLGLLDSLSNHDVLYFSQFANATGFKPASKTLSKADLKSLSDCDRRELSIQNANNQLSQSKLVSVGLLNPIMYVSNESHEGERTLVNTARVRLTPLGSGLIARRAQ